MLAATRRTRAVRTLAGLVPVVLLAGCGAGPVDLAAPAPAVRDAEACLAFAADLPEELAGEERRELAPSDAVGAAWGDPAITVACGVDVPPEFDRTQSCEVANGVGWYVPDEVFNDQSLDVTMTAVGYRPVVRLRVPAGYRPNGPAAAIAVLAGPVKEHLRLVEPCT